MNKLRIPAVFLAAALQLAPISRTVVTNPAAVSTFSIILRWTIGATAALGAFDAVSGASTVFFTGPTNATGYVGYYFSFTVTLGGTIGSDPGAKVGAVPLPPGLTNLTHDGYNENPPNVYGVIYGTPTTAVTNFLVHLNATHPSFSGTPTTNLYLTMLPIPPPPPQITNQPVNQTVLAGGNANFTVTAGGGAPLGYQWRRYGTNLANATNASLVLTRVRTNQAGDYAVVVTNSANAVTSSIATLTVNVPVAPRLLFQPAPPNLFSFSFNPVAGLTNTVQTNGVLATSGWAVLTNIAPPANTNTITITNAIVNGLKLYRVVFAP